MNLFELFATITLDDSGYKRGLDDASKNTSKLADNLEKGLATAAKIGTAAITAAAASVAALTKASLQNYAKQEQLVGGIDTLFKNSSKKVQEYASEAYRTSGMSANEYMETVTGFSASLLQSLENDTEAAAEYANMAITDMADNANKMGNTMESIQNAYNGFAKGNFTMLDNLRIGYQGSEEEMKRLLADAEKLSGIEYDISSYADIVDAIHVIQTEMGITGTTALEAGTTIQGSIDSMKAAWNNLVTSLGDENANVEEKFDELVVTIVGDGTETNLGVMGTVVPRIKVIFGKFTEAIKNKLSEVDWALEGKKLITLISNGIDTGIAVMKDFSADIQAKVESIDWYSVGEQIGNAIANGIDLVESIGEAIKNTDWEQLGEDMAQFLINSFQKKMRTNFQVWGGITGDRKTAAAAEKWLNKEVVQFSSDLGFNETLLTTGKGDETVTTFVNNSDFLTSDRNRGGGRSGDRDGSQNVVVNFYGNVDDTLDKITKKLREGAAMLAAQ